MGVINYKIPEEYKSKSRLDKLNKLQYDAAIGS